MVTRVAGCGLRTINVFFDEFISNPEPYTRKFLLPNTTGPIDGIFICSSVGGGSNLSDINYNRLEILRSISRSSILDPVIVKMISDSYANMIRTDYYVVSRVDAECLQCVGFIFVESLTIPEVVKADGNISDSQIILDLENKVKYARNYLEKKTWESKLQAKLAERSSKHKKKKTTK